MWLFYELKHRFCFFLTRNRSWQSSSQSRQSQGRIHWREWEHPEEEPVGKNNNRTIVMLCNGYFNTITVRTNTTHGITAEKHIFKVYYNNNFIPLFSCFLLFVSALGFSSTYVQVVHVFVIFSLPIFWQSGEDWILRDFTSKLFVQPVRQQVLGVLQQHLHNKDRTDKKHFCNK